MGGGGGGAGHPVSAGSHAQTAPWMNSRSAKTPSLLFQKSILFILYIDLGMRIFRWTSYTTCSLGATGGGGGGGGGGGMGGGGDGAETEHLHVFVW